MGMAHTLENSHLSHTDERWEKMCAENQKLKEDLATERARTSKLRRYIAGLNQTSKTTATSEREPPSRFVTAIGLQKLVEHQGELLEQLYQENAEQQSQLARVDKLNRQLLTANDKLRRSLLAVKKQTKPRKIENDNNETPTLSERFQLSTPSI